MLARFFARRPVFACVIAITVMLAGAASLRALPVAQYPDVAPPGVHISASYPGASAEAVENSVTQVLEQQLTGIDGLLSFASSSRSSGRVSIDVAFQQGTDPDTAQIQVQNKVQQAVARLPQAVQQQGVVVTKSQSSFLMIVAVCDRSDRSTGDDLADYLASTMQDPIARVDGVGGLEPFGASYAMRIWLDPGKLASYGLMPSDVARAISAQNVQVSAGKIGQQPALPGQQLTATVTAQGRLHTASQFRDVIVKASAAGATVRVGDVARVELGSESYDLAVRLDGHPASALAVLLSPDANALAVAEDVKAAIGRLERTLPPGWAVSYPFDTTKVIRLSILEVVKTLIEAIALVVIVMFAFLQRWRATVIPVIAVPVVLLGACGVLRLLGCSINTLTLFGMVLSIGLLVDDTIVVVENVERLMREHRLPPQGATLRSMQELTGALVGVATVLSAVFLPMAFFTGSTGVVYRQFAITITASMLLSVLVALTITPAMCVALLRAPGGRAAPEGPAGNARARSIAVGRRALAWFSRGPGRVALGYQAAVARMLRRPVRWLVPYAAIVAAMAVLLLRLPTGFLPTEDQGIAIAIWTLPPGAALPRTQAVARAIERHFLATERANVASLLTVAGYSYLGVGQNAGIAFVELEDRDARAGEDDTAAAISRRATAALSAVRDAEIFALTPPAIQGLGQFDGFDFELQATAGTDRAELARARDRLLGAAAGDPRLAAVRPGDLPETPQLEVDIDHARAFALGVAPADIADTLTAAWGGVYVDDFLERGRVKRVFVQGDAAFRGRPEDLDAWYVRGASGRMASFGAFATTRWIHGAESLARYNGLAAYEIQGMAAPGVSSGAAMDELERIAKQVPGTTYAWRGLSYQEHLASGQTVTLYAISILVVFLCLAALYESWSVPLSVLLVIPLGVVGAALAATLRGLPNDVYFRVALLTTIGLASKNAILIVEFAEAAYRRGASIAEAALGGARLRLRPIVMTSLAFAAGVAPLVASTGAGANSRVSIGTGILGGTLTGTVVAIFFVPVFFAVVRKLARGRRRRA